MARLSSRSIPTGPGSRGGVWGHKPPPEYFVEWRRRHPEYRERDRRRRLLAHALTRLTRVLAGGPYKRPKTAP